MRPDRLAFRPALAGLAITLLVTPGVAEQRFVDDAGRSVVIRSPINRLMPAGPPADLLLFALAPDRLVGLVKPWTEEQRPVVPAEWRALPIVPRLTPDPLRSDLDAVRALAPDLVVDYGDVTPAYAALADRVTEATGVPAVVFDGHLRHTPRVLRSLGRLIGAEAEGNRLAALAEEVLSAIEPLSRLRDDERVPVYFARGGDGLEAVTSQNMLDESIRLVGGRNVVARRDRTFHMITVDEVKALAPRVVIVEQASAAAPDGPLRRALPPSTVFVVDDVAGFHFVGNPPSINRLIGAAWLAGLLHPERPPFDECGLADLRRRLLQIATQ